LPQRAIINEEVLEVGSTSRVSNPIPPEHEFKELLLKNPFCNVTVYQFSGLTTSLSNPSVGINTYLKNCTLQAETPTVGQRSGTNPQNSGAISWPQPELCAPYDTHHDAFHSEITRYVRHSCEPNFDMRCCIG
jgi:hypothetical protein